jgi:hypothetical protein
MIERVDIDDAKTRAKRLRAVLTYKDGKTKTINFGQRNSKGTYFDGATEEKRSAYLKRHSKNEDWADPTTAGFMSRWVLWSEREKASIIKLLKSKTGASVVTLNFKKYNI